jgi:hypothetical protein
MLTGVTAGEEIYIERERNRISGGVGLGFGDRYVFIDICVYIRAYTHTWKRERETGRGRRRKAIFGLYFLKRAFMISEGLDGRKKNLRLLDVHGKTEQEF